MALAGIDMALWDALARVHGTSLMTLLGGVARLVPAFGAVGHDGAVESAKVAESWVKRGFTGVKAKVGYETAAADVAVVRAIRSAVGPNVAIMVTTISRCCRPKQRSASEGSMARASLGSKSPPWRRIIRATRS